MTDGTVTATAFIASQPREMPASEVVELGKSQGLRISNQSVYNARSRLKNGDKPKRGRKPGRKPGRPPKAEVSGERLAIRRLILSLGTDAVAEELELVKSMLPATVKR